MGLYKGSIRVAKVKELFNKFRVSFQYPTFTLFGFL